MSTFIIFSCLFAAAFGSVLEPPELRAFWRNPLFPNGRIVGGVQTDITKIPYQVALEYGGLHFCGGSIISENHILTAAHCIIGPASKINVRIGTSSRNRGGVVHTSVSHVTHPKYNENTLDYDAAIIKLTNKIQFTDKARPIKPLDSEPSTSASVLVSGWGLTQEEGQCSPTLQSVSIPIISRQQCIQSYASFNIRVTDRMICAYVYGKDSCQGDSGGPAAVNGQLAGIVSWGVGCARPNFPGVYSNVAQTEMRSFIRTHAQV